MELQNIFAMSTDEIAAHLATRTDLVKPNGLVSKDVYLLRTKLGPIACTDSFGVYMGENGPEILAIIRNTDEFAGKICAIGGGVALYESLEDAVKRHWKDDLGYTVEGLDWRHPVMMNQFKPGGTGEFYSDAKKHSLATAFVVSIDDKSSLKVGATEYGQEASGYVWLTKENFPGPDDFAYGFYSFCKAILDSFDK
jgi:hypothetical protein